MKETVKDFREDLAQLGKEEQFSPEAIESILEFCAYSYNESKGHTRIDAVKICCGFTEWTGEELINKYFERYLSIKDTFQLRSPLEILVEKLARDTLVLKVETAKGENARFVVQNFQ